MFGLSWEEYYDIALVTLADWRDPLIAIAAVKYIFTPRLDLQGINHSLAWIADMSVKVSKKLGKDK